MSDLTRSVITWMRALCILLSLSACSQINSTRSDPEIPATEVVFSTQTDSLTSTSTSAPAATDTSQVIIPTQDNLIPTDEAPPQVTSDEQALPIAATGQDPVKPSFDQFVDSVKNGNAKQIVGVYVENVLALRVVQQPSNQPAYVSLRDGESTQFLLAATYAGNIGLLAHNFLAGRSFFELRQGDIVQIIYGDGNVREYEVERIEQFQALKPDSPTSDFLDLDKGDTLSATRLFNRVYGGEHHLTFQTCIDQDNNSQWGRLFVIANPL